MKRNMWVKVFAFIALIGIVLWIFWTWILFLFESNSGSSEQIQLTEEQIQELIQAQEWNESWSIEESDLLEVLEWTEITDNIEVENIEVIQE